MDRDSYIYGVGVYIRQNTRLLLAQTMKLTSASLF